MKKLIDCPFCGDELNFLSAVWTFGFFYMSCKIRCSCGAEGPKAKTLNQAIALWNERI